MTISIQIHSFAKLTFSEQDFDSDGGECGKNSGGVGVGGGDREEVEGGFGGRFGVEDEGVEVEDAGFYSDLRWGCEESWVGGGDLEEHVAFDVEELVEVVD